MIGYFVKSGDVNVDGNFTPYIRTYRNIVKQVLSNKVYGTGLKLILIEYLLEGKFMAFPDKRIQITPLRKKEQALSVRFGVPRNFGDWNEIDKKQFIINTTKEAVQSVRDRLIKKEGIDIDFIQLELDLEKCASLYLFNS